MMYSKQFLSKIAAVVLLTGLFAVVSCIQKSSDDRVRKILADIAELQTKEEALVKPMIRRENIFSPERIEGFPQNRREIEPIAREQIESLESLIELEEEQIRKIDSMSTATADGDFLQYASLNKQIFEKRRDNKKLGIQKFTLILDPTISTRQQLDENILKINITQDKLDQEISELDRSKTELRKRIGK